MVKRVSLESMPRASSGGLGPRGHNVFSRLFGDRRSQAKASTSIRRAPVVAVGSGKGGTGKSFLATSLACVLHRQGHRVTLVDCDFGMACDHLLLGVKPTTHLQHVLQHRAKDADALHETPAGPKLLPGVTGVRQMAALPDHELTELGKLIGRLATDTDIVLLDTGAGLSPQTVLTLCAADHLVLVTQPEIAALTDAYAVVKSMAQLRASTPVSVVTNRVTSPDAGRSTFQKLKDVADRHTGKPLEFLGEVDDDPTVTQKRLGQLPLVATDPNCATADAVRRIGRRLIELVGPLGPRVLGEDARIETRFAEFKPIV